MVQSRVYLRDRVTSDRFQVYCWKALDVDGVSAFVCLRLNTMFKLFLLQIY